MQNRDYDIIAQLQDAWAFETRLLQLVQEQVDCANNAHSRRLYTEHARLTQAQRGRIELRLGELGANVNEGSGWFTARLNRLALEVSAADFWRDEDTQLLITSYGIKQLECAMYNNLLNVARHMGDKATGALARASLEEEEATARRLLYCIGMATRSNAA